MEYMTKASCELPTPHRKISSGGTIGGRAGCGRVIKPCCCCCCGLWGLNSVNMVSMRPVDSRGLADWGLSTALLFVQPIFLCGLVGLCTCVCVCLWVGLGDGTMEGDVRLPNPTNKTRMQQPTKQEDRHTENKTRTTKKTGPRFVSFFVVSSSPVHHEHARA